MQMIASNDESGNVSPTPKKNKPNPGNKIKPAARKRKILRFLTALRDNGGCVWQAVSTSGLAYRTASRWRAEDSQFDKDWEEAKAIGMLRVEEEAIRRAYAGTGKKVYYKGEVVGEVTEYSDRLIEFILKGHFPEKYKERYRDTPETSNDIPIGVSIYDAIRNPTTAPSAN
jgi:hypothetical protein